MGLVRKYPILRVRYLQSRADALGSDDYDKTVCSRRIRVLNSGVMLWISWTMRILVKSGRGRHMGVALYAFKSAL